jgi:hypothetical protein
MTITWKETTAQGMSDLYDLLFPKGDYRSSWDDFSGDIYDDKDEGRLNVSEIILNRYSNGSDVIVELSFVLRGYYKYHALDIAVRALDFFARKDGTRHTFELSQELREDWGMDYLPGTHLFPEKLEASLKKLKIEMLEDVENKRRKEEHVAYMKKQQEKSQEILEKF